MNMHELRSIDAELDAMANYQALQMRRLEANWPAESLLRKQEEFRLEVEHAVAVHYWTIKRNQAAQALVELSEAAIQCKPANISQ